MDDAAANTAMPGRVIGVGRENNQKPPDKVVVSTVEQTLNALLDAEADQLCKVRRYRHTGN